MATLIERSIRNGSYTYRLAFQRATNCNAVPAHGLTPRARKKMLAIYIEAQIKNLTTRKKFQVDHIIPLYGVNICGLHVPGNLRILSKNANQAKSNFFRPYIEKKGRKVYIEGILPCPERVAYIPPRKGRANPTKKSSKRRAKKLVFGKRNFGK